MDCSYAIFAFPASILALLLGIAAIVWADRQGGPR